MFVCNHPKPNNRGFQFNYVTLEICTNLCNVCSAMLKEIISVVAQALELECMVITIHQHRIMVVLAVAQVM